MPRSYTAPRTGLLAPSEWLFLGLVIVGFGAFVIALGKDMSWDFRNYHWYAPYAFLNGRMAMDVAVAHQASYYNPLLDIPFYLLATKTSSWFALGVLGMVQGANVVPLYVMARSVLRLDENRLAAIAICAVCMTGGLTIGLAGTTYYDNVLSVFALSGLAIIVFYREELENGPLLRGVFIAAIAGFIVGSAVGLKLPQAPFALGFAAALIAAPGDAKHRLTRLAAGGIGGVIGVALFSAYWLLHMDSLTGNPLFPYFNDVFHSPLVANESYRDMRFLPNTLTKIVGYPILFSWNWQIADDLPFTDIRVGLAYVAAFVALGAWILKKRSHDPLLDPKGARIIFAFATVSYLAWLKVFAIYRYIVTLEMLAPLVLVGFVGMLPFTRRTRLITISVLFFAAVLTARSYPADKTNVSDPYVQNDPFPIPDPDHAMILMTGEAPLGFLAPSIPHQIPLLRIDGWMLQPEDGTKLTSEMKARVKQFKGTLFILSDAVELQRTRDALSDYGLVIRWPGCRNIHTNLGGPYLFCPLTRKTSAPNDGSKS